MQTVFEGVDHIQLADVLASGVDHGGNPIEPFTDDEGGWPLRCCLCHSLPGERLAIIAWSPFTWDGPYRETGPIVVHADQCPHPAGITSELPATLNDGAMVLRPYSHERRILYSLVTHLPANSNLTVAVQRLLDHPEVAEVHGRNPTGGCFAFAARRSHGALLNRAGIRGGS
jgi:Protein of unknown function (DUF1203)